MTKQKHKILKRIGAAALLLALIATPIGLKLSSVSAAANEIATVDFATVSAASAAINNSFTFTAPADASAGDKIVVRIPNTITSAYVPADFATDVTWTGGGATGDLGDGTASFDTIPYESINATATVDTDIVITADTAGAAGNNITIAIAQSDSDLGASTPATIAINETGNAKTVTVVHNTNANATGAATAATGTITLDGDVADGETVTIGTRVYEFDTNSSITGDVAVDVSGGVDKATAQAALLAAVNGDGSAVASLGAFAADASTVTADTVGTGGNSIATTETGTNIAFAGATLGGAIDGAAIDVTREDVVAAINRSSSGTITGTNGDVAVTITANISDNVTASGGSATKVGTVVATNLELGDDQVVSQVTYTLGAGDVLATDDTVTVTFAGDFITAPASAGQYSFSIRMQDSTNVVYATGAALLTVNSGVAINATVQESLVLTIDGLKINLNVDPTVNLGKDYSQKSVLTGKTNAQSGYIIQGKMANSTTANAELYNTDASTGLAAGDALGSENAFGYVGYNANVNKTQAEIEADAAAAAALGTSATPMIAYDASSLESTNPTNSQEHTVYYVVNVDFLTPAGTYEGTITYTAVPAF